MGNLPTSIHSTQREIGSPLLLISVHHMNLYHMMMLVIVHNMMSGQLPCTCTCAHALSLIIGMT